MSWFICRIPTRSRPPSWRPRSQSQRRRWRRLTKRKAKRRRRQKLFSKCLQRLTIRSVLINFYFLPLTMPYLSTTHIPLGKLDCIRSFYEPFILIIKTLLTLNLTVSPHDLYDQPIPLLRHTSPCISAKSLPLSPTSVTRLGDLLVFGQLFKPFATINLHKSPTFLGNFCKGVKIYNFRQLL